MYGSQVDVLYCMLYQLKLAFDTVAIGIILQPLRYPITYIMGVKN